MIPNGLADSQKWWLYGFEDSANTQNKINKKEKKRIPIIPSMRITWEGTISPISIWKVARTICRTGMNNMVLNRTLILLRNLWINFDVRLSYS